MDHGNIYDFVENHEGVNRVQLVSDRVISYGARCDRFIQLVDVAKGLEYMHSLDMVHGDLKGVRSYLRPRACPLTTTTRQTSLSTTVSMPASPPLVVRSTTLHLTPPRSPPLQAGLTCRPSVGRLGGWAQNSSVRRCSELPVIVGRQSYPTVAALGWLHTRFVRVGVVPLLQQSESCAGSLRRTPLS